MREEIPQEAKPQEVKNIVLIGVVSLQPSRHKSTAESLKKTGILASHF